MKKMSFDEMKKIDGGRWKCKDCGAKYWTYVQAATHQNCTAHYTGIKWCF